jgi:hypothetical protein
MPKVNTIFVIHTTRNQNNANTDASFELEITDRPFGSQIHVKKFRDLFPSLPHNERERGRTDSYRFDVSDDDIDSNANEFKITMRMVSTQDGWLPESIFVIGITPAGAAVLLGSHPNWPTGKWFDRGDPRYSPEHTISGSS